MCRRLVLALTSCFFVFCLNPAFAKRPQEWLEVRSPHFTIATNGSEKQARRIAQQFELIRAVYKATHPKSRVDPGEPVVVLAAKDEDSMRALLPGYWEKKGQARPAGVFVRGREKHYVALRLDAQGENPYHVVYHEYIHLLISLNVRWLPVWLNEGLAEFFASAEIDKKQALIGRPTIGQINVLRENQPLPLEVLFTADRNSPYYNEDNKATMFYAQSWVVTHYLMVGAGATHIRQLANYLLALQNQVPEADARQKVFGDPRQLEEALGAYIRQYSFPAYRLPAPEGVDEKEFAARELSAAESLTVQGDFLLHTGRFVEARTRLEEALRLDPNLAAAHESLGFLHLSKNELPEADKQFAQAVQLDSRSYLAHYYHAMLTEKEGHDEQHLAEAEASLRRAMQLNNEFAPAYGALASLLGRQRKDLPTALAVARRAVALEPGVPGYHLTVANVLMQMEKAEEARKVVEGVLNNVKSPEDRAYADALLASIKQYQQYQEQQKLAAERQRREAEEFSRQLEEARKLAAERAAERELPAPEPASAQAPAPAAKGIPGWSAGRIIAVRCATAPEIEITLKGTLGNVRLHAANYSTIDFKSQTRNPPASGNPCRDLQGHEAAITYRSFKGSPYDGEIVSVEVRK